MNIGIVYSQADQISEGRELEKLADGEILQVGAAVKGALEWKGHQAELVRVDPDRLELLKKYDWIFNLAESVCGFPYPEFEIARRMEELGLNFTGSGSVTLKNCSDKARTKEIVSQYGIVTPAYGLIQPGDENCLDLKFPLFVKPVHEDGSIGIFHDSLVYTCQELKQTVARVHAVYNQAALVEEYIEGRDITVSILGNGSEAAALPCSEIIYLNDFRGPKIQTYEAKWVEGSSEFAASKSVCPAALDDDLAAAFQKVARQACRIMGCRDYARVDFRLRGRVPFLLEVNPNPCINPVDSGYVRAGKAQGLGYEELINDILERSIDRSLMVWEPVEKEVEA
jgi:D-alanine-D-alanine ligase